MTLRVRIILFFAIGTSLMVLVSWCFLEVGYSIGIRQGLCDGESNKLGFNNPVTAGLAWRLIKLGAMSGIGHLVGNSAYSMACGLMHLIGLSFVLGGRVTIVARRMFFGLQSVIFPICALGLLIWAFLLAGIEQFDGECIDDMPQIMMAGAPWILISWFCIFLDRPRRGQVEPTSLVPHTLNPRHHEPI